MAEIVVARRHLNVVSANAAPTHVYQIVDGWAGRCLVRKDGSRQILGILTVGDYCDLDVLFSPQREYDVVAFTEVSAKRVAINRLRDLIARYPETLGPLQNLWVEEVTFLRRLMTHLGRGSAVEKLAFILCHLCARQTANGLRAGQYFLPLSQSDLADVAGLTPVHANRTMKLLRNSNLIDYGRGSLTIFDADALQSCVALRSPE